MSEKTGSTGSSRTIESVHRTCLILGYLIESNGAGVTEIAQHLGFHKATVHNHLATLYENGFVRKTESKYHLGYKFVEAGETAKREVEIYEAAWQELSRLAQETGEYLQLIIEEDGMGIYLIKMGGENAIGSDYHVGQRQYLHHSAAGKTILAYLPDDRVREIVESRGLPPRTEHTITESEELFDDLERIRERGYALSDEEAAIGIRAVGVPVLNPDQEILGAISLSGPLKRITDRKFTDELPEKLMEVANIVEIQVNYHQ
jgi:DNA-binding IclR family transcriptional regulator